MSSNYTVHVHVYNSAINQNKKTITKYMRVTEK